MGGYQEEQGEEEGGGGKEREGREGEGREGRFREERKGGKGSEREGRAGLMGGTRKQAEGMYGWCEPDRQTNTLTRACCNLFSTEVSRHASTCFSFSGTP